MTTRSAAGSRHGGSTAAPLGSAAAAGTVLTIRFPHGAYAERLGRTIAHMRVSSRTAPGPRVLHQVNQPFATDGPFTLVKRRSATRLIRLKR